jgi:hypothetical protein
MKTTESERTFTAWIVLLLCFLTASLEGFDIGSPPVDAENTLIVLFGHGRAPVTLWLWVAAFATTMRRGAALELGRR